MRRSESHCAEWKCSSTAAESREKDIGLLMSAGQFAEDMLPHESGSTAARNALLQATKDAEVVVLAQEMGRI